MLPKSYALLFFNEAWGNGTVLTHLHRFPTLNPMRWSKWWWACRCKCHLSRDSGVGWIFLKTLQLCVALRGQGSEIFFPVFKSILLFSASAKGQIVYVLWNLGRRVNECRLLWPCHWLNRAVFESWPSLEVLHFPVCTQTFRVCLSRPHQGGGRSGKPGFPESALRHSIDTPLPCTEQELSLCDDSPDNM